MTTAPTAAACIGKILLVDDNPDLVESLADILTPQGFKVVSARTGADAIELARGGFDVAIVDVKLPDVTGVDLIAGLRDCAPLGEVVLITGYATVDSAIAALRSGAFAFILKSFRPEELIATVEQANTKVHLKKQREELERRYRALVELTDVIVVAFDAAGDIAFYNRKASELTGVPLDQARGRDFCELWVPPEDHAKLREAMELARGDQKARDLETGLRVGCQARRVRWHLSSTMKGAKAEGNVAQKIVYAIGIDVTERRALEKRAADAEALSAMGTLALNLAHEIRNPLNAAKLQLHLLGRDIDKSEVSEDRRDALHRRIEIVGSEILRLNRLLTEFLELARPRGIAREPVHVGKLLDDVVELERESAERVGVRIEKETVCDGCVTIADREKLKQVAINLVNNSLEAMKEGGILTVRSRPEGDAVVFEVEDTGVGIDADVLPSIFDPFFTTKAAGTGLGLSIVRKIIDQHGGTVVMKSERGSGTTVTVRIPTGR